MLRKSYKNSLVKEAGVLRVPFLNALVQGKMAILVLLAALAASNLWAFDGEAKIREGVKLHDRGDFTAAIEVYQGVLKVEPENGMAWYELANSYFAQGDFKSCLATAKKGRKNSSGYDSGFHTISGNCYSSSGDVKKALRSFRSGLEIAPNDASLNFNIAITLFHSGDQEAAIRHLEVAIDGKPSYASPYFLLGEAYRVRGDRVRSLFYLSRFFSLETGTSRSVSAATAVFKILSSGIEKKSERQFEIVVPSSEDDDPLASLDLMLSIAGFAVVMEDVLDKPTEAHRKVEALTMFYQMVLEMSGGDGDLKSTKVWRQAIAPILRIHQQEASETLGFLMAWKADVEGAGDWVEANPERIEGLEQALGE